MTFFNKCPIFYNLLLLVGMKNGIYAHVKNLKSLAAVRLSDFGVYCNFFVTNILATVDIDVPLC